MTNSEDITPPPPPTPPAPPAPPAPPIPPAASPYGGSPHGGAPAGGSPYGTPGYGQPGQPTPQYAYQQQYGAQQAPRGSGPLYAPLYGATPVQAIARFFQKYAQFNGRASRSEYWWVQLAFFVVYLLFFIPITALGGLSKSSFNSGSATAGGVLIVLSLVLLVAALAVIVPSIALTVRRLHDAGFSGLLYLLVLIPYVGSLIVLILAILPSKPEGARFD